MINENQCCKVVYFGKITEKNIYILREHNKRI